MKSPVYKFIECNASLVLLIGIVLGLASPLLSIFPASLINLILAAIIYLALFKMKMEDLTVHTVTLSLKFVLIRFLLVPVFLWSIAYTLIPAYSKAVLLMSLLPAGSSSAAFTSIVGGSVGLSVAITLFSSIVSVLSIPTLFSALEGHAVVVPVGAMGLSLFLIIGSPIALFFTTRNIAVIKGRIEEHGPVVSNLLIAFLVGIVLSHQRDIILQLSLDLIYSLSVLFVLYALYFVLGWFLSPSKELPKRISFLMTSGLNNNALGIGLSASFLPSLVLFFVLSEIPWCCGLIFARFLMRCVGVRQ